jgi:hypothetical protein
MGMEPIGYAPRNMNQLWIDPLDYQNELEQSIEVLARFGIEVRILQPSTLRSTPIIMEVCEAVYFRLEKCLRLTLPGLRCAFKMRRLFPLEHSHSKSGYPSSFAGAPKALCASGTQCDPLNSLGS